MDYTPRTLLDHLEEVRNGARDDACQPAPFLLLLVSGRRIPAEHGVALTGSRHAIRQDARVEPERRMDG